VFARISRNPSNTLDFLQQRNYFKPSSNDSQWDQEWRTVLLFLELYSFILKLTDDDDFFAGLAVNPLIESQPSRVRSSALALADLKRLTQFLKNLSFCLHYHSADLLQTNGHSESSSVRRNSLLGTLIGSGAGGYNRDIDVRTGSYYVISGLDFGSFKALVTAVLQMLYERDSRRPFLPPDQWLMTSSFDMDGFQSAVVLEEQRQQELQGMDDSSDVEDDEDSDSDSNSDLDLHRIILSAAGRRVKRNAMMENAKAQQQRVQRERLRAAMAPKLEILRNMPYIIPFAKRVEIFRQFVYLDKQRRREGYTDDDQWRMHVISQHGGGIFEDGGPAQRALGAHTGKIRRESQFADAFRDFYSLGVGLKEPVQITFVDKFDTVEAGIDGGGVTKEFLTSVTKEAFTDCKRTPPYFVANQDNALYPNPVAIDVLRENGGEEEIPRLLQEYEFLGRVLGKCLYEGILIDIAFAGFFLLKWSSSARASAYRASVNDLREMDEELYQGMLRLKNYNGDAADLGIDFTIDDQVSLPSPNAPTRTVNKKLIPNGDQIPVTNDNRPLYISYVARHRLVAQPHRQTAAFLRGLGDIIDPMWLSMFNQSELQRLVGGDSSEIDVEDLRDNTIYSGVYEIGYDGKEHETVQLFWKVMRSLKDEERRAVLKYVTSTPRAPLLGFSQLKPRFSIRDGGSDEGRLPSASTCVNLLKLPRYKDEETLRSKLLYAVCSGAGFDLS
jgi:ubiquitin-protein ligase E3 C